MKRESSLVKKGDSMKSNSCKIMSEIGEKKAMRKKWKG